MSPRLVTTQQIQRLDRIAIEQLGIPSAVLMENAGRAVACAVLKRLRRKKRPSVCIFCGLGNNAGDGFVVARHLWDQGVRVKVFVVGNSRRLKNNAARNYCILKKLKCPVRSINRVDRSVLSAISLADVLVDAIFGVGLNREITGNFKSVINALNLSKKKIVAVDIPSGLDGTTGEIYGSCVKAAETDTFTFLKKGFRKNQGPKHAGRVVVIDIGIPRALTKRI